LTKTVYFASLCGSSVQFANKSTYRIDFNICTYSYESRSDLIKHARLQYEGDALRFCEISSLQSTRPEQLICAVGYLQRQSA